MDKKSLSVVFPCRNEEGAVAEMFARLAPIRQDLENQGWEVEVIVVDDASTDRSAENLLRYENISVITNDRACGYGGALKRGFLAARAEWIIFLDMDRTYCVEDIPALLKVAVDGGFDMVYGRRPFQNSGMPIVRRIGNAGFVLASRLLFGARIRDVCTGFRVFHRRRLAEILALSDDGLNFSIQLTSASVLRRWKIHEIPVRYEERLGESKLSVFADGFRFLWTVLRAKGARR